MTDKEVGTESTGTTFQKPHHEEKEKEDWTMLSRVVRGGGGGHTHVCDYLKARKE